MKVVVGSTARSRKKVTSACPYCQGLSSRPPNVCSIGCKRASVIHIFTLTRCTLHKPIPRRLGVLRIVDSVALHLACSKHWQLTRCTRLYSPASSMLVAEKLRIDLEVLWRTAICALDVCERIVPMIFNSHEVSVRHQTQSKHCRHSCALQ